MNVVIRRDVFGLYFKTAGSFYRPIGYTALRERQRTSAHAYTTHNAAGVDPEKGDDIRRKKRGAWKETWFVFGHGADQTKTDWEHYKKEHAHIPPMTRLVLRGQ